MSLKHELYRALSAERRSREEREAQFQSKWEKREWAFGELLASLEETMTVERREEREEQSCWSKRERETRELAASLEEELKGKGERGKTGRVSSSLLGMRGKMIPRSC